MIKFDYLSVYDPEDVVPGDVLMEKEGKNHLVVVDVDEDSEEYICLMATILGYTNRMEEAVLRVGFEKIDNYKLVRPTKE